MILRFHIEATLINFHGMTNAQPDKQTIEGGYGPAYHRIYSISFPVPKNLALEAMLNLQKDPNQFSPQMLATFEKVQGSPEKLAKGDEFTVHISGPWDGPVRVSEVTSEHFKLETLEGHLEAGEIHFRIEELEENTSRFQIESLARSKDVIVDFIYDKLPLAKLVQTEMWCSFCKNFADHALGISDADPKLISEVTVITERQNEKTGEWERI